MKSENMTTGPSLTRTPKEGTPEEERRKKVDSQSITRRNGKNDLASGYIHPSKLSISLPASRYWWNKNISGNVGGRRKAKR